MKVQKQDWSQTSIGGLGRPIADEFYQLANPFILKHLEDPTLHPNDLACILSEVVKEIAMRSGAYVRYDSNRIKVQLDLKRETR